MFGAGKQPPKAHVYDAIFRVFPELNSIEEHPLVGARWSVGDIIIDLNEATDCSREAIADWLCVQSAASIG
jgi:hypothetical protein